MKKGKSKIKEFFKFRWFLNFLGLRQTKYGSNTLLAVVVLLGILILVNYVAQKESIRWDLTKIKQYTLSDQTKKVVENIDEDVKVIGFFQSNNPQKEEVADLLEEYRSLNNKLSYEFIDPDIKPTEAKRYEVARYGTLVFEKGGKREQSLGSKESDITSSILKLTRDVKKYIYFLTGHNEKDIEGLSETDYGVLKQLLEREGYQVKKLSLVSKREIPEDASVVVIAGPKAKILDEEKQILGEYLDNNGKILALLDSNLEVKEDINLYDLFLKWGIKIEEGVVIDPVKYYWTDVASPVVDEWKIHQVTNGLSPAFFMGAIMVEEAEEHPKDVEISILAETSEGSWLERNVTDQKTKFDEDNDIKGPIPIAMVVKGLSAGEDSDQQEEEESHTRIVVIGDSDFANNIFAESLGNFDFALNSIDWLAEEEELISIRPKEEEQRTVTLTGNQARLIFIITVAGMPLLVIIIGIGAWMDRRRKRK